MSTEQVWEQEVCAKLATLWPERKPFTEFIAEEPQSLGIGAWWKDDSGKRKYVAAKYDLLTPASEVASNLLLRERISGPVETE